MLSHFRPFLFSRYSLRFGSHHFTLFNQVRVKPAKMSDSDFHSRAIKAETAIKSLQDQLASLKIELSKKRMSTDAASSATVSWMQPDSKYPKWWTPYEMSTPFSKSDDPIMVLNSLVPSEKVPFIPKDGKLVRWYTCGPTVYASSHMGHARNYVTFDIIRNILEYYFGFRVNLVMNITDVDDKIILRARQNHLFDEYAAKVASGEVSIDKVVSDVEKAFADAISSKKAKLDESGTKLKDSKSKDTAASGKKKLKAREVADIKIDIEGQKVKLEVVERALVAFKVSLAEYSGAASDAAKQVSLTKMLDAGKSALSEMLDAEHGSSVTDQGIFRKHSEHYESEFFDDMRALNVRDPDVLTRVTEYIDNIVDYVSQLVDSGYAYESNGSVYFSIGDYMARGHDFPKLDPFKGAVFDELSMIESEGALGGSIYSAEKRDLRDFALWKKSKSGEPMWQSPWGFGRPGWHIECSAMASHVLGDTLDIHSGGEDLKFPHHDNEMAQSCAYFSRIASGSSDEVIHKQWVNYWFHAGHLHIEGLKMSKSLKNFISIKEALELNSRRQIRLMFLMQAWNAQMDYSTAALRSTRKKEHDLFEFFLTVNAYHRMYGQSGVLAKTVFSPLNVNDLELNNAIMQRQLSIDSHLRDNFDYVGAIRDVFGLMHDCNVYLLNVGKTGSDSDDIDSKSDVDSTVVASSVPNVLLLDKVASYINEMLIIFGVIVRNDGHWLGNNHRQVEQSVMSVMDSLTDYRYELALLFRAKTGDVKLYQAVWQRYDALAATVSATSTASDSGNALQKDLVDVFVQFHGALKEILVDPATFELSKVCKLSDSLRDDWLPPYGIEMEDLSGNSGAIWKLYGPDNGNCDYYLNYLDEEKKFAEQEIVEKRAKYLDKEINVWHSKSFAPSDYFKEILGDKYSVFDEATGLPTHDSKGKELSKKASKKLPKLVKNQEKQHAAYLKKQSTDGDDFLERMRIELTSLKAKLSE